jgi:hypothetical protein
MGVHRKLPHLGDAGMGVHRKLPHLGDAGKGIHRKLPLDDDAPHGRTLRDSAIRQYIHQLSERASRARFCVGDWRRVCGESPTVKHGLTAVFLDPPYGVEDRADCYGTEDSRTVAADTLAWCLEHGDDPLLRIALCGYDGEHNALEDAGWSVLAWKASGGYANQSDGDNANARRERVWFSPNCIKPSVDVRMPLFASLESD